MRPGIIGYTRKGVPIYEIAGAQQAPAGVQAQRPQPQTTGEPSGGPFIRHSRRSSRPGYSNALSLGGTTDQPLSAAPGYLRWLDLYWNFTGGGNATTNSVAGATSGAGVDFFGSTQITTTAHDAVGNSPWSAVQFVQVKDSFGTVILSGNGYEMLYLWPYFNGQVGLLNAANLNKWPSAAMGAGTTTGTATTNTGNWFGHTRLPFEIVPGYGCLSIGDASLQPALHINAVGSGSLYATVPSTTPTGILTVDEHYWPVPSDNPGQLPPGLGTTLQCVQLTAQNTVGTGSSQRVAFPRLGGFITTIVLIARDAAGNRNGAVWPAFGSNQRIRLYMDGVPILDEMIEGRVDMMYEVFGGMNGSNNIDSVGLFPAGVIAYSYKNFESQVNLGHLDNGEGWVSSTPGTLIELECTPWGTFSGGPATITALVGAIVPKGQSIVQT